MVKMVSSIVCGCLCTTMAAIAESLKMAAKQLKFWHAASLLRQEHCVNLGNSSSKTLVNGLIVSGSTVHVGWKRHVASVCTFVASFDIRHPYYGQLMPVKQGIHWLVSPDHITGSILELIKVTFILSWSLTKCWFLIEFWAHYCNLG